MVVSAFFVAAPPILLASFIVSASNIHDVGWISIGRLPIYWCRRRSFNCCSTSNNNANDNDDYDDDDDDDDDNDDDDNDNDSSSNNYVYDDDAEYMADAVFNDVVRISSFIFS